MVSNAFFSHARVITIQEIISLSPWFSLLRVRNDKVGKVDNHIRIFHPSSEYSFNYPTLDQKLTWNFSLKFHSHKFMFPTIQFLTPKLEDSVIPMKE